MSDKWLSPYIETVKEAVSVSRQVMEDYLKIGVDKSMADVLVYKDLFSGELFSSVPVLVDKQRHVELTLNETPSANSVTKTISFPALYASKTFIDETFLKSRAHPHEEETEALMWLISFYGMLHEAFHIYIAEEVNKNYNYLGIRWDSMENSSDVYKLVAQFVLDMLIEQSLAPRAGKAVQWLIEYGSAIHMHPHVMEEMGVNKGAQDFNVSYIHCLRTLDRHLIFDYASVFEDIYEAIQPFLNFEGDLGDHFAANFVDTVDIVYTLLGNEHDKRKEEAKKEFANPIESRFGTAPKNFAQYVFLNQVEFEEPFENFVIKASSDAIHEARDFIRDVNSTQDVTVLSSTEGMDLKLKSLPWVKTAIYNFVMRHKTRRSLKKNKKDGFFMNTNPVKSLMGSGYTLINRRGVKRDKPQVAVAVDGSTSMFSQSNDLITPVMSLAYELQVSLVEVGFRSCVYAYKGYNEIEELANSEMTSLVSKTRARKNKPNKANFSSIKLRGATPEHSALQVARAVFRDDINSEKLLILLTDGYGNYTTSSKGSKRACRDEIEKLESEGIIVVYLALTEEVYEKLQDDYGDRAVLFNDEAKYQEKLMAVLDGNITSFSN